MFKDVNDAALRTAFTELMIAPVRCVMNEVFGLEDTV